ncbi:MAG: IreB family regulatory phosphoprotein [Vallitaleaceae bacterium]|nr:IreB family regulatory phosphoprotein [Vallitaleaceae bacterium]
MGLNNTQFFKKPSKEPENQVKKIMKTVYEALSEKGYNPMYQIVGYILSGDPTYITSHNNARTMISQIERDELLEELVKDYIEHNVK